MNFLPKNVTRPSPCVGKGLGMRLALVSGSILEKWTAATRNGGGGGGGGAWSHGGRGGWERESGEE